MSATLTWLEQGERQAVFLLQDDHTIVGRGPRKADIAEYRRAWIVVQVRIEPGSLCCRS